MFKDWKTTVPGLVSALAGFVAFAPDVFHAVPWVQQLASYVMLGGFAALGIAAKSVDTGSEKPQEVVDAKLDALPAPTTHSKVPPEA